MDRPRPIRATPSGELPEGRPDADDLLRWAHPAQWVARRRRQLEQEAAEPEARPMVYRGEQLRSELEGGWARTLDHLGIAWEYEKHPVKLASGERYLPDFWLPAVRTFIEAKGTHAERRHKPEELAKEIKGDVIVLIGWPPIMKRVTPYLWDPYMQWLDPLGYDTRLAQCPGCSGWQWMRAQLSRRCRICGAAHTGLLAKSGELPFYPAEADRPSWMDAS